MVYKTKGIILRKQDFREADCLYVFYTKDFGKITLVARGAKKISSKLAGHLDYFGEVNLSFATGKAFDQISGAVLINNYSLIKSDLDRSTLAFEFIKLIDQSTKEKDKDESIYQFIINVFNYLNTEKDLNIYYTKKAFLKKLGILVGTGDKLKEFIEK